MRYHLTSVRMAVFFKKKRQQELARMWRNWQPCAVLVGMQNGAAAMENSMEVPQKLKIELTYDPTILLLSIYPKELKSGS